MFAPVITLILSASMWRLSFVALAIAGFGVCTGAGYVLAFSLLGSEVSDNLRGRTFATLYTSTRLCLFLALVVAPFLSALVDVSDRLVSRQLHLAGVTLHFPGVRIALWLAGLIILGGGWLTRRAPALRPGAGLAGNSGVTTAAERPRRTLSNFRRPTTLWTTRTPARQSSGPHGPH